MSVDRLSYSPDALGAQAPVMVTPATPLPVTPVGGGTGGATQVEGTASNGSTDSGNPISTAGLVNTGVPASATTGQRKTVWVSSLGTPILGAFSTGGTDSGADLDTAFLISPAGSSVSLTVRPQVFNSSLSQWQRARGTTIGASVVLKPEATGGGLIAKVIAAANTNATSIKASAGQILGGQFFNASAATCYLKLYNKASAPTVGTDIPVDVIGIPAGGRGEVSRPTGNQFSVGIAYAITLNPADSDTTAVAASAAVGSFSYI